MLGSWQGLRQLSKEATFFFKVGGEYDPCAQQVRSYTRRTSTHRTASHLTQEFVHEIAVLIS